MGVLGLFFFIVGYARFMKDLARLVSISRNTISGS
jgi:hypothetical protein